MTTPLTGEVSLTAGDTTYTLKLSAAALVLVEDVLDISVLDLPKRLGRPRLKDVRVILWAALQEHHKDGFAGEAGVVAAGDVVSKVGLVDTIATLGETVQAAFPARKADAGPQG